jgi:hypothetical protein
MWIQHIITLGYDQKSNPRIHGVDEGAEMQSKVLEILFNEIIAETFPYLCNNIDSNVHEAFYTWPEKNNSISDQN